MRDSVFIAAPPERVWAWLNELPAHYRDWHPDHITCRYERGRSLEVDAVLYVEERLHQRLHRLCLRATEVVPCRLLRYRTHGFTGAFSIEPANEGTRFTAEVDFGMRTPVLGPILDTFMRRAFGRRFAALESHMREEGANLKRLLEGGQAWRSDCNADPAPHQRRG